MSSRPRLRWLGPGHHSSEETSQRWRVVGNSASDLTGPRVEPQTYRVESDVVIVTPIATGAWFIG